MDQNVGFFPLPVLLINSVPALFTEKEGQLTEIEKWWCQFLFGKAVSSREERKRESC